MKCYLDKQFVHFEIWLDKQAPYEVMKRSILGGFGRQIVAKVFGAVSIVNAIAIGKGCTLGIDTFVETRLTKKQGTGIYITSENKTISSRLN